MDRKRIDELVMRYCKAQGPVSVVSITRYVREQFDAHIMTDDIEESIARLIKKGSIEQYDGGIKPTYW